MNNEQAVSRRSKTLTLLFVTSLTVIAGATVAPALPGIRNYFAATPHVDLLTRLLLTMPALTIAISAPGIGWMLDRFGRRRILVGAIILYVIAGTSGIYLSSLKWILVGRAILGISVAGTNAAAITLIGDYFEGPERNRILGYQGAFAAFGGFVFLPVQTPGRSRAINHW